MKAKNLFKFGLGLILALTLCFITLNSFAHKTSKSTQKISQSLSNQQITEKQPESIVNSKENLTITIDSNTTNADFEEIKKVLKENDIIATFTNIERNENGNLIGLKISLKDPNNNEAVSQISANTPISPITFGRKDGLLYITQSKNQNGAFALFNRPNMMPFGFENDSLMKHGFRSFGNFNFNDFFSDEDGSFFFDGKSMDLDDIRDMMRKQMESRFNGNGKNNFSWFFDSESNHSNSLHQFQFIDDPNSERLIIIDGKESDFKTLDSLAKSDKLNAVDILKPETAISVYGEKAKDGAIIATTKSDK